MKYLATALVAAAAGTGAAVAQEPDRGPAPGAPVTDMAAVQCTVDYLNTVEQVVSAAISQGLSLEKIQAKVTMEDWGGYALFNWVHPGLNAPAAFDDLA